MQYHQQSAAHTHTVCGPIALTDEVSPVFRALDREPSVDDLVWYLVLVADRRLSSSYRWETDQGQAGQDGECVGHAEAHTQAGSLKQRMINGC